MVPPFLWNQAGLEAGHSSQFQEWKTSYRWICHCWDSGGCWWLTALTPCICRIFSKAGGFSCLNPMVSLLATWSSQVVCGTKHRLLSLSLLQTREAAFAAAHTTHSSTPAPGSGQGSQADPQGRTIMSQAWDKKKGPGFACNAPWQWNLLLDFKDEMFAADGVFGHQMGRGEHILGNAGWAAEVATEVKTYFTWNRMMQVLLMNQKTILFS